MALSLHYDVTVGSTTDRFVIGETKPIKGNVGVPAGAQLTAVSGDITITATGGGPYVSGSGTDSDPWYLFQLDITGRVICRTGNIVIDQCRIHPNIFGTSSRACVDTSSTSVPTTSTATFKSLYGWSATLPDGSTPDYAVIVKDSTLAPDAPSYYYDGVHGRGFLALRCEVYHCTDGFGMFTTAGTVCNAFEVACYVHDHAYGANDPGHTNPPDGSHSDGCQMQGGTGCWIIGSNHETKIDVSVANGVTPWLFANQNNSPVASGINYYDANNSDGVNANIGVQVNQNTAATQGGVWKSWMSGGRYGVNLSTTKTATYGNFTAGFWIVDVRCGRDGGAPGRAGYGAANTWYAALFGSSATQANCTVSGVVYDDDGSSAPTHL